MPGLIEHPGFGNYRGHSDRDSDAGFNPGTAVSLRTGFVCEECKKSVLAYKQPRKCEEHEVVVFGDTRAKAGHGNGGMT